MRAQLFMYAFVCVALLAIFQYVNSKHIFESYQEKMTKRIEMEQVLKDSIKTLNTELTKLKTEFAKDLK